MLKGSNDAVIDTSALATFAEKHGNDGQLKFRFYKRLGHSLSPAKLLSTTQLRDVARVRVEEETRAEAPDQQHEPERAPAVEAEIGSDANAERGELGVNAKEPLVDLAKWLARQARQTKVRGS